MGIMREKLCVLLLIHTSNLSSCKWNHYFLISYERLLSPLAPFPRSSVRTLKVCLGWDGGELPCASTHIFLGITESKREALPAIAPVSNVSLQQTKCTNASRTLSGLYCMSHGPFHLHPVPEGHRGHLEWGRQNCRIPTKISSLLPEFPALFFPLVIFVSCKQQTQRRSHATLLHIGHQWDQRRFNLLFPAHSIFYLTYQKERRQTLKNVPQ